LAPRSLAFLASGALALTACGGESFSGAESDKGSGAKGSNPTCAPKEARLKYRPKERAPLREPIPVDLSRVPGGNAERLELTVTGASTPSSVEDVFTDKGRFRPGVSNRFVAVEYSIKNKAKRQIEAANSVNSAFVVADREGRAWLRADNAPNCGALSASAAVNQGDTSPEGDIAPGKSYDTTAIYVVPRTAKGLSWIGPGVRVPLKPR